MISDEVFTFWSVLETDLELKVPCYIKNSFTLCNLDNAAMLASVDESDIDFVEQFIRTSLYDILVSKSKELKFDFGDAQFPHFFGSFIVDRGKFSFSECDILIIKLLIAHVKYIIDSETDDNNSNHIYQSIRSESSEMRYYFANEIPGSEPESNDVQPESVPITSATHTFLNKLIATANQNAQRPKGGYRYSDEIKKWASYLRIVSGRFAYETIQKNIPLALPAFSSTNRYITQGHDRLIEGQLRISELSEYLNRMNLPRMVSLSEDATRINGVPQYDPKSNEILGFVLPLRGDGMPIPHSYPARNFNEIYSYFQDGVPCAHFVNVVMAQPMANVEAFCLLLFCSNSQYTSEDVAHRWELISKELQKADIRTLAVSSDSEPKYNWFSMSAYEEMGVLKPVDQPYYIQDTIHIATKLRNMFLKTMKYPNMLPFGPKYHIQVGHIESIIRNIPKDQHRLNVTVLNQEDKQNFDSVLRITDESVIKLLKTHVLGSEATIKFLQLTRDVIDAYRNVNLSPLERIDKLWYAIFILRIWRAYISSKLNAHSMILVMLDLKNSNSSSLFMPHLLESQPCESMFRQLRSMSTVYSTVTNCSLREIIDRLNRIELQSEIAATSDFVFPRFKTAVNIGSEKHDLPTKDEIFEQVERSKTNAIQYAFQMGLIKNRVVNLSCQIASLSFKTRAGNHVTDADDESNNTSDIRNKNLIRFETLSLKNFADHFVDETVPDESRFVEVPGIRCRKVIKKSSLVWLLRGDSERLSSDRLYRVRARLSKRKNVRRIKKTNHFR